MVSWRAESEWQINRLNKYSQYLGHSLTRVAYDAVREHYPVVHNFGILLSIVLINRL